MDKNEPMLKDIRNCNAWAVCQEKKSQLDHIEEDLLQCFFNEHANGIKLSCTCRRHVGRMLATVQMS